MCCCPAMEELAPPRAARTLGTRHFASRTFSQPGCSAAARLALRCQRQLRRGLVRLPCMVPKPAQVWLLTGGTPLSRGAPFTCCQELHNDNDILTTLFSKDDTCTQPNTWKTRKEHRVKHSPPPQASSPLRLQRGSPRNPFLCGDPGVWACRHTVGGRAAVWPTCAHGHLHP